MIKLREVTSADYRFLYSLLAQRDSTINISHKRMPTYEQHVQYLSRSPYLWHRIITLSDLPIGMCYRTIEGYVGIFLDRTFQGFGYGPTVLQMIIAEHPRSRLIANVNPSNRRSMRMFRKAGFKFIQMTYALEPLCDNTEGLPSDAPQPPS